MEQQLPPFAPPLDAPLTETVHIGNDEAVRMHTAAIRENPSGPVLLYIQAGDDLNRTQSTSGRMLAYMLIESALGSALVIAVSGIIIMSGLRPFRRILRHIQGMEAPELGSRLPVEPRPPELDALAASLDRMWERLDAAFRARAAFVAGVSHDLRTPLTILQGQFDVLSMSKTMSREDQARLRRMQIEMRRLIRMTDNVLLYAELGSYAPREPFREIDLSELVREVATDFESSALGHDITLAVAHTVHVNGDFDLLKQALLNVVDNAVKFTPTNGHISISLNDYGDTCIVAVADNGIGISPGDLPHVTEPYYRARHDRSVSRPGTGLGLSIVEQIVKLHDGRLTIDSRPGDGTLVSIELAAVAPGGHRYSPPLRARATRDE
jgi:signal transduction histidine kinase